MNAVISQTALGPPGEPLLATPAQEQAFQGGIIAIAVLIAILAAAELVGRSPAKWRAADPHAVLALVLATLWAVSRAFADLENSATLQLSLALLAALGLLVGTAWRPARLLAGVTAITVVPEFAITVAMTAGFGGWSTTDGIFWASLIAGLNLTALLIPFSIAAAAMRLARLLRPTDPAS